MALLFADTFETGTDPWYPSSTTDISVSTSVYHSGSSSMRIYGSPSTGNLLTYRAHNPTQDISLVDLWFYVPLYGTVGDDKGFFIEFYGTPPVPGYPIYARLEALTNNNTIDFVGMIGGSQLGFLSGWTPTGNGWFKVSVQYTGSTGFVVYSIYDSTNALVVSTEGAGEIGFVPDQIMINLYTTALTENYIYVDDIIATDSSGGTSQPVIDIVTHSVLSASNPPINGNYPPGTSITTQAVISNTGNVAGTATVVLTVNGDIMDTKTSVVDIGGTSTIIFAPFTVPLAGSYNCCADVTGVL